jgi:hypothetical protein
LNAWALLRIQLGVRALKEIQTRIDVGVALSLGKEIFVSERVLALR